MEYWGLNDLHLEPCCQHTYYRARWLLPRQNTLVLLSLTRLTLTLSQEETEEDFGTGIFSKTQKTLWNLFENPHHSCAAKVGSRV